MEYKQQQSLNEAIQRVMLGEGDSSLNAFDVPMSPHVKDYILQTKKTEFLWSADSVLGGKSKFIVIPITREKGRGFNKSKNGVLMAIISNPDRGGRKIFIYMGSHQSVQGAQNFAKNNKLVK